MKSTAVIVTDEVPLSFSVTVRLALLVLSSRLMPLKPASAGERGRSGVRMASNCVARLARTVVSVVCCAWLIERLCRLHQLGDRGDAVVGGLDRVDAVRHRVEQVAEVAGAVASGPAR